MGCPATTIGMAKRVAAVAIVLIGVGVLIYTALALVKGWPLWTGRRRAIIDHQVLPGSASYVYAAIIHLVIGVAVCVGGVRLWFR